MKNELKVINLKFRTEILTYTPTLLTIFYIIFINLYLKNNWNYTSISQYTSSFNALSSLIIAITVYQVIHFEESIGHFNHILGKPKRNLWVYATLIYIFSNYLFCLLISTINFILMSQNLKLTLFYIISSSFMNIITILLIFTISLFTKSIFSMVSGVVITIFNIYFGIEVLGDKSWYYIPITYSTRYTSMFINNSVPFLLTISIYVVSVAIIFTSLLLLVKKWSGRSVQD
ncbi:BsaG family lantibiotic immunity ABC transporter permease subunit [Staphylococcus haemolyticus]|uniref:BsaG family lantibiotic immunity ABC transporter permease subunit n=1 Tax=Staphylococcus haemolyticus TaxID=1283 RepID=UPI0034D4F916